MIEGSSRHVVAIFCEDVRQEMGGKSSLMGVLLDRLIFSDQLPEKIRQLCIVFFFRIMDERPKSIVLRVTPAIGEPLTFSPPIDNMFGPSDSPAKQTTAQVNLVLNGMEAPSGSSFLAEAIIDGVLYQAGQLTIGTAPNHQSLPVTQ